jgi:thiol-disulfide isomerase/thioredoxin
MNANDTPPPTPPDAPQLPNPPRRGLLLAAVAGAAVAAGAGVAVWRGRSAPGAPAAQGTASTSPDADTAWLWDARFQQPAGGELQMASLRGKPLLLNFWATWCPPCIKEMPEFDRFHRDHAARGWQVLGLAVDSPKPVRDYLQRMPVGYAIGLAGFEGTDISRKLGNTQGALPFTVLLDARGKVLQRRLGETNYAELAGWAAKV